ncbi:NUDIX domain protein [Candidatus Methanoperedenaceae archaeon GB50]|nr:NUDIX domain protein [Candidatus Methanoperedenaceae archaeon GB50]
MLLIKRKNPPGEGEWNIPGGLVKVGETLEQAIVREVEEETGIKIS